MRGSDCASRYVRVPSDEDEDSAGRRLNTEQNELGKPNNGVGTSLTHATNTKISGHHHHHNNGTLSWKRRACFAASLAACLAYVIVMLRLPCQLAPCPTPVAPSKIISDSRWTSAIPISHESTALPEVASDRTTDAESQTLNFTVENPHRRGPRILVG